ncbi:MAG: hypothetical protein PHF97_12165 [Bacteroidales bacterium]|nr:hypothetical protein [Bacteroidales bacterium]
MRKFLTAKLTKNDIWPGMELSPICLFRVNCPAVLYNHPDPPASFNKTGESTYIGSQQYIKK